MKVLKEFCFRFFIILVMLSLVFVAYDMSKPVISSEKAVLAQDVIESIMQPFKSVFEDTSEGFGSIPSHEYNFIFNMLLPILVYLVSIGGFMYLLIEDYKLLRTFSRKNKLAKYLWTLWMIVLICLMLIPIFFGFQMVMKGFVLAVIATAIFLIIIGILYWMSCNVRR